MNIYDQNLMDEVRHALTNPWNDPVLVWGKPMSRKTARMIERELQR